MASPGRAASAQVARTAVQAGQEKAGLGLGQDQARTAVGQTAADRRTVAGQIAADHQTAADRRTAAGQDLEQVQDPVRTAADPQTVTAGSD
ncbi:hypothetical protein HMPREF3104_11150 [Corynebacterium sp. HMSC30G07]|nr:hypothetical protein HMPREF3104_11150 [Corynebacterium sp. HMSC30G07]